MTEIPLHSSYVHERSVQCPSSTVSTDLVNLTEHGEVAIAVETKRERAWRIQVAKLSQHVMSRGPYHTSKSRNRGGPAAQEYIANTVRSHRRSWNIQPYQTHYRLAFLRQRKVPDQFNLAPVSSNEARCR